MAAVAQRRLQKEIELAIKKVTDGVKDFQTLWEKVEDAQVMILMCPFARIGWRDTYAKCFTPFAKHLLALLFLRQACYHCLFN